MKIYANTFELRTPVERRYYAAPNSIFAFAVKATLDGEDADGTITVFQGSTELTPMEATVDGYKLYQRTSGSETAVNEFDIVYTKGTVIQHFTLIENITDSTVFDIDQQGGAMLLPIASDSVLGGIKVGDNLTIEADGTLNADAQELTPATATTLGGVIVGNGLSVDENGKIDALAGEETDPVFENWLSSTENVKIGKSSSTGTSHSSIAIGKEASSSAMECAIAIGWKSNANSLNYPIAIGTTAKSRADYGIAIGFNSLAQSNQSIVIGPNTVASAEKAIQIGEGTNNEVSSFQVYSHKVLDQNGNIPEARLGGIPTAVLSGTYSDDTEFSFMVYTKLA